MFEGQTVDNKIKKDNRIARRSVDRMMVSSDFGQQNVGEVQP